MQTLCQKTVYYVADRWVLNHNAYMEVIRRIKISHKIFLSLMLVTSVALGLLAYITWRALDRGFLDYVSQLDTERTERVKTMLRMEYIQAGETWERIRVQPGRWRAIIRAAEENEDIAQELRTRKFPTHDPPPRLDQNNEDDNANNEEPDPWDRLRPPPQREDDPWDDRPPRRRRPAERDRDRDRDRFDDDPFGPPPRYNDRPPTRRDQRRRPPERNRDPDNDQRPQYARQDNEPPPRRKAGPRREDDQDPTGPMGGRLSLYDAEKNVVLTPRHVTNDPTLGTWEPIEYRDQTVGYLHRAPRQELTAPRDIAFVNKLGKELLWVTLALLSLAALVAMVLARQLIQPLRQLTNASRRLSAGEFTTRVPQQGRDEIAQLSRDFNNLALTLEENEEARQRWTADISHELRTPLAVLRAEIEAVKDGIRKPDPKNLDSLLAEVEHLGKIVSDLYELSLADIGALTYHKRIVDLSKTIQQVGNAFRARIEEKGLRLQLKLPSRAPIFADPDRLHQLFTNFLENSCRYTDSPGQIMIAATIKLGHIELTIDDSSPAPANCDQMFNRLYRDETSRNRAKGGAGLGLALCRNIVEAHEGTIQAAPSPMGGLQLKLRFAIAEEA